MAVRVAINGFGRIGRLVFRAASAHDSATVKAINEPFMDLTYMILHSSSDIFASFAPGVKFSSISEPSSSAQNQGPGAFPSSRLDSHRNFEQF